MPSFDREKPIEILERAEESRPEKGWRGGDTPPPPRRSNIRKDRPAECDLRPVSRDPQVFFLGGGGGCTGKDYIQYMDTEYRKVCYVHI